MVTPKITSYKQHHPLTY